MKYIVIGAGISGLSIARMLSNNNEVLVFESQSRPGGLIKCDIIDGSLFHRTGGHVFNSKREDVLDWFWNHFNKEKEFIKAMRNSSVCMPDGKLIPYPIENHAYLFNEKTIKSFIDDLLDIVKTDKKDPQNFEEFLKGRFGETLYQLYFQPYNYKIWRRDLSKVSLSWLEGKLPMPTVEEMIFNNFNHVKDQSFVHSSFYYAQQGGSQFLADRFSRGLEIRYNTKIEKIEKQGVKWLINGEDADRIIFCGNIKQLPSLLKGEIEISEFDKTIEELEFHGTTAVFCDIEINPYSWIYLPSQEHESHRIICTGNFAESNNAFGKMTGTVEFTDYINKEDILENLKKIPFTPKYLTHHYEKFTYPIQNTTTREMIDSLRMVTEKDGFYLLGRFAEWEYYNMDAAIGAALDLFDKIQKH